MQKSNWSGETNWTDILEGMDQNTEIENVPAKHYTTLCTTRTRVRCKVGFEAAHWSLKMAKGFITIRRKIDVKPN